MNQKLRRVFFAGLGTACALILTDPVTASPEHGPIRMDRISGNILLMTPTMPQMAGTGSTAIRTVWRNATISIRTA